MIQRKISKDIIQGAQYFPVVAIIGPRQSGKTTLAKKLFKEYTYVSLEDFDLRQAAIQDPRTFLQVNRNEYGLIIDEFQYAPQLLSYIQTIVDTEQKVGTFIITGSQNFLMNQSISQSLAGRVSLHTLLPLSTEELASAQLLPATIEHMLYQGSYPALYAKHIAPDLLYKNYLQTYVERDVRQLTHVGDLTSFQTFIGLCAARVGQLINFTSLANDCGISDGTAKRWLSILQASYIVFLLQPYHTNFGKRLIKNAKIFFYDSGLVCHLLKMKQDELAFHALRGNIFESFIISEIVKWHYNHGRVPHLYFWRDQAEHEIDCIIDNGTQKIPVEIKASRTLLAKFFDNLKYWNTLTGSTEKNFVVFAGPATQTTGYGNVVSWQSLHDIFKYIT